jgi:hypothetical protein
VDFTVATNRGAFRISLGEEGSGEDEDTSQKNHGDAVQTRHGYPRLVENGFHLNPYYFIPDWHWCQHFD